MAQLMLLFRVGAERYALETASIVEVIHRAELSKAHKAEGASERIVMAGRFNYHGQIIPVLDLNQLLGGGPSRPALGTRIVLVRLAVSKDWSGQHQRLLGLLVEQVTETLEGSQFECIAADADSHLPYLGETLLYQQEMIQSVRPDQLLSAGTYDALVIAPSSSESEQRSKVRAGVGVEQR